MTLGLVCGYWVVGFTIHRGATDCTRTGMTSCNRTGSTGGLKTWCLTRFLCGINGGALSFCRTGGSTLHSPGNMNGVGGQTLLSSCLFTHTNKSTKAPGFLASQWVLVLYDFLVGLPL